MYVSDLALHDFRSWPSLVIALQPGVTALVGPNGQGKTNIVEAIGYLGTLASHRASADTNLVRRARPGAVIRANVDDDGHTTLVEVEVVAGKANRAKINRGNVKPRAVIGLIPSVVFSPEDLDLVRGDPAGRRRFLDELATVLHPRLAAVRSEYDKVARHRVALLKSMSSARRRGEQPDLYSLQVWNDQLARAGAQIIAARASLVTKLRAPVERAYRDLSGDTKTARIDLRTTLTTAEGTQLPSPADLAGAISADDVDEEHAAQHRAAMDDIHAGLQDATAVEQRLLTALAEATSSEIDRGINLIGPHRDDLTLNLGPLPAKGYASHGESWSYALALRLGAWSLLRDEGSEPILILDDVFAELDAKRRRRLAELVTGADQVLITAAVGDDLPESLAARRLLVQDGTVTPAEQRPEGHEQ